MAHKCDLISVFKIQFQSLVVYFLIMIPSTRKTLQSIAFFAGDKIYTDITEGCNLNYIGVCDESAIKLLKTTTKTLGIIFASLMLALTFPIYAFVINNELQFPIPVIVPFTDLDSRFGLGLNILNQLFMSFQGITGNFGIEIMTCMVKNSIWASTVAIGHSIWEFSSSIEKTPSTPSEAVTSKRELHYQFRNILIQVQDHDRYVVYLIFSCIE